MPFRIVLSYRRRDAAGSAGRLYEDLAERFGDDNVFMDVTKIGLGRKYIVAIHEAIDACDVFLALIGPHWLTAADEQGHRRLDDPDDLVRRELEAALEQGVGLIPVLFQDVEMPSREELPPSLALFPEWNAHSIRDTSWRNDAGELINTLEHLEQEKLAQEQIAQEQIERERRAQERIDQERIAREWVAEKDIDRERIAQEPIEHEEFEEKAIDRDQWIPSEKLDGHDRKRVILAAAVAALLLGASLAALFLLRDGDEGWDRLVYAADGRIFTVGPDGEGRVDLTGRPGTDGTAAWSPDGTRLALERGGAIWVVDASGENGEPVTSPGGESDGSPDWSPDGTRIAFNRTTTGESGTNDVLVIVADGTRPPINLTPGDYSGAAPDWSPRGDRIVFQSKTALWTVDANRRDAPQRLQLPPELRVAAAHQPAWSDHGLAFALFRGSENSDIYVAEVEGDHVRNATNLTSAYAAEWRNYPAWSTDGERIVFATLAGISTIDRTGSLDGLITGEGLIAPSWRPPRG